MSASAPTPEAALPRRLSHLADELLARQAGRGSERAFTVLYERYHQKLYRYCRSILRNEADAQDALQATFAGALVALRRDQRNAPLRPWLYRIAHNESISLLRRRSHQSGEELSIEMAGLACSAEQEVSERARWRTLVEDLGRLPDRQRGALLLRELNGLSHEEIAFALGTTTAAAKQTIFEARQALAAIQEGRAMSCEEVRRRISEGDRRVLRGRQVAAHLRACAACEAFALAIPARQAQLRAFTPALAPMVATALLRRSLMAASARSGVGAGGTSGAAGGAASTAATSGTAGKAIGTALMWKGLAGVAVVATTAAGVSGVTELLQHPAAARVANVGRAAPGQAGHEAATAAGRQPSGAMAHGNVGAGSATARPSGAGRGGASGRGTHSRAAHTAAGRGSASTATSGGDGTGASAGAGASGSSTGAGASGHLPGTRPSGTGQGRGRALGLGRGHGQHSGSPGRGSGSAGHRQGGGSHPTGSGGSHPTNGGGLGSNGTHAGGTKLSSWPKSHKTS